jgi:hypothetical protein
VSCWRRDGSFSSGNGSLHPTGQNVRFRWRSLTELGYHWIWFGLLQDGYGYGDCNHAQTNLRTMAAPVVIVSMVDLIVSLLARGTADEKLERIFERFPFAGAPMRKFL